MNTALVYGDFAPLHAGHQRLINTARRETDHTIVMINDAAATTTFPLPVRAGWIRQLYPDVEIIEAWHAPWVSNDSDDSDERKREHAHYLLSLLNDRKISHYYSIESDDAHLSELLGAVHHHDSTPVSTTTRATFMVRSGVDATSDYIPVSATAIRNDPHAHKRFIDPLVYRDLVTRVAFLGAPSTGKSSLAKALAERHQTVWMPEYGKEYWIEHQQDRRLTPEQLVEIATGHIEREDKLLADATRYLFIDTEAIVTYQYALDYHGAAAPELIQLATAAEKRYDLYFLCADDIPYDNTWERSGAVHRAIFQKRLRADLIRRRVPFITLRGDLPTRIEKVEQLLSAFDRYAPRGDSLLSTYGDQATLRSEP